MTRARSLTARVAAQAKVNLFLRVLGREPDGYHNVESLIARLDLADDVRVRARDSGRSIHCEGPAMPATGLGPDERNLAYRAAVTYAEAAGWPAGFEIEITKKIPVGGGLGGGSADAGAVLRALEALSPKPLGEDQIIAIAGTLGSDVPACTIESPLALVWGRGERLLALPALPPWSVTLWTSAMPVSTADAYAWLDEARGAYVPEPRVIAAGDLASWDRVARLAENDFERVVPQRHEEIGHKLGTLRVIQRDAEDRGFALLAGSGATVFAVTDGRTRWFALGAGRMGNFSGGIVQTRTAERVEAVAVVD